MNFIYILFNTKFIYRLCVVNDVVKMVKLNTPEEIRKFIDDVQADVRHKETVDEALAKIDAEDSVRRSQMGEKAWRARANRLASHEHFEKEDIPDEHQEVDENIPNLERFYE